MAITVEYINGYEILAYCPKAINEAQQFAEFSNRIGPDGHRAQVLFGADTGLRSWTLTYASLPDMGSNNVILDGAEMTPAEYIWDLYCRQKVTGEPFAVQGYIGGQKYLGMIDEQALSFESAQRKLYTTGIKIEQVRVSGVTVFSPAAMRLSRWYDPSTSGLGANPFPGGFHVLDLSGNVGTLDSQTTEDIALIEDEQNGRDVVRLNVGLGGSYFLNSEPITIREAFLVLRINEAEFSNFAGVVSCAGTEDPLLIGADNTTKFYDFNREGTLTSYVYKKNGVAYAESNQQAPMNTFGLIYIRANSGILMNSLQVGKERSATDRYAKMDFAEMIFCAEANPSFVAAECAQHLITKWGIGE